MAKLPPLRGDDGSLSAEEATAAFRDRHAEAESSVRLESCPDPIHDLADRLVEALTSPSGSDEEFYGRLRDATLEFLEAAGETEFVRSVVPTKKEK